MIIQVHLNCNEHMAFIVYSKDLEPEFYNRKSSGVPYDILKDFKNSIHDSDILGFVVNYDGIRFLDMTNQFSPTIWNTRTKITFSNSEVARITKILNNKLLTSK